MSSTTQPPLTSKRMGVLNFNIPDDGTQVHITGFPAGVKWVQMSIETDQSNGLQPDDKIRLLFDNAPGVTVALLLQVIVVTGSDNITTLTPIFLPCIGQQFQTSIFGTTDFYVMFDGANVGNTHVLRVLFGQ